LTEAGLDKEVAWLQWSPEGSQILFTLRPRPWRIYLISADGGQAKELFELEEHEEVTPGSWSPDGSKIAYRYLRNSQSLVRDVENTFSMWLLDLAAGKTEKVPGSERVEYGLWSPDGRYLAACRRFPAESRRSEPQAETLLYDFELQQWIPLLPQGAVFQWSRSGEYLYFHFWGTRTKELSRIRVPDGEVEKVADWQGLNKLGGFFLTPDDSILISRSLSNRQVYALDFETR
jgi:hypothetical protein